MALHDAWRLHRPSPSYFLYFAISAVPFGAPIILAPFGTRRADAVVQHGAARWRHGTGLFAFVAFHDGVPCRCASSCRHPSLERRRGLALSPCCGAVGFECFRSCCVTMLVLGACAVLASLGRLAVGRCAATLWRPRPMKAFVVRLCDCLCDCLCATVCALRLLVGARRHPRRVVPSSRASICRAPCSLQVGRRPWSALSSRDGLHEVWRCAAASCLHLGSSSSLLPPAPPPLGDPR